MPRTNVRYAFKALNGITGIMFLATLIVCGVLFWSKLSANYIRSKIRKHAERILGELVFSYVSLSSLKPSSLFLGWLMENLKCCGFIDPYDFQEGLQFSSEDTYDGRKYNGIAIPIPCCELNSTYQLIDSNCPCWFSTSSHQYTVGCREVFGNSFVRLVNIVSYSSLFIILLGISMIACCVLILRELWKAF
ncbi:unnamed protein product [Schistosoma turkestanicum]|nr:unnamed protein product [Schistosoma turkestanicum]